MDRLFAVIRREYVERIRSKWFLVSTLLAPILLVGAALIPTFLVNRQLQKGLDVSVVDETGAVLPELLETEPFESGRFRYIPPPETDPTEALRILRRRVEDGALSGYIHIPADMLDSTRAQFWSRDASTVLTTELRSAVGTATQRVLARRLGLAPAVAQRLTRPVDLENYRLTEEGVTRERGQTEATAWVLAFLIYMVVLMYGAMMLRAAVAEKTNKMVEIILSSIRPWQLMLGKTVGVGAVGLTQVAVWLSVIATVAIYAATGQAVAGLDILKNLPIGPDTLLLFASLFLTGYFLYAGVYAAVGAIATTEQEAAQLQIPVTVMAVVPILVLPAVLNNPGATSSVILSWVPFFAPVLYLARYVMGATAVWETPIVFVLIIAAVGLVAWLGGRIYRVGLLMTGKRPTLPELYRWIRHG